MGLQLPNEMRIPGRRERKPQQVVYAVTGKIGKNTPQEIIEHNIGTGEKRLIHQTREFKKIRDKMEKDHPKPL
jgi:hypothetical protein